MCVAFGISNTNHDVAMFLDFMHNARVRKFDADYFVGPTLYETDVSTMNIPELRDILESLSLKEDKLVSISCTTFISMECILNILTSCTLFLLSNCH